MGHPSTALRRTHVMDNQDKLIDDVEVIAKKIKELVDVEKVIVRILQIKDLVD